MSKELVFSVGNDYIGVTFNKDVSPDDVRNLDRIMFHKGYNAVVKICIVDKGEVESIYIPPNNINYITGG